MLAAPGVVCEIEIEPLVEWEPCGAVVAVGRAGVISARKGIVGQVPATGATGIVGVAPTTELGRIDLAINLSTNLSWISDLLIEGNDVVGTTSRMSQIKAA